MVWVIVAGLRPSGQNVTRGGCVRSARANHETKKKKPKGPNAMSLISFGGVSIQIPEFCATKKERDYQSGGVP